MPIDAKYVRGMLTTSAHGQEHTRNTRDLLNHTAHSKLKDPLHIPMTQGTAKTSKAAVKTRGVYHLVILRSRDSDGARCDDASSIIFMIRVIELSFRSRVASTSISRSTGIVPDMTLSPQA